MATKKVVDIDGVPDPVWIHTDFDSERKDQVILFAKTAFACKEKGDFSHWKQCAEMIKKDFEEKAGPTYHCIVGSHFGSFVSHESKCIAYFSIGQMIVLLWKHG